MDNGAYIVCVEFDVNGQRDILCGWQWMGRHNLMVGKVVDGEVRDNKRTLATRQTAKGGFHTANFCRFGKT